MKKLTLKTDLFEKLYIERSILYTKYKQEAKGLKISANSETERYSSLKFQALSLNLQSMSKLEKFNFFDFQIKEGLKNTCGVYWSF